MKKNYSRIRFAAPFFALALAASAKAGTAEPAPPPPAAESEDKISAVLNLDFNTHFISYGADVWGDGRNMSELNFNPMFEVAIELPANFTFTLGTWWDVTSKGGDGPSVDVDGDGVVDFVEGDSSPLGGRIQEVDVWAGLAYTVGDFTIKTVYQAWMYGDNTENILDVVLSYDTFLSPSITVHNRLDQGAAVGDEGTVVVGALSYSFEAGPVTIAIPFNIAWFATDGYHGGDDGIGYGSIGLTATYPLTFLGEAYGDWNLHGGLTYYVTDQDVIPGNVRGDFLTANIGIGVSF